MTTITEEIKDCLWQTRRRQSDLARAAGVSPQTISFLVTGAHKDVRGKTQDAIRNGISILLTEHLETQQADEPKTIGQQRRARAWKKPRIR